MQGHAALSGILISVVFTLLVCAVRWGGVHCVGFRIEFAFLKERILVSRLIDFFLIMPYKVMTKRKAKMFP